MRFIIVTMNQFPSGDAGSVRELSFCKLLKDLEIEVTVISQANCIPYVVHSFQDFQYISLRSLSKNYPARVMNYFGHRNRLKRTIEKLANSLQIDAIWVNRLPIDSMFYLKNLARKKNIKLYHDSVEWFSPQNFRWGKFSFFYLLNEFWNRELIDQQVFVISISTFLNNYFNSKKIHSIRIPVILDTLEIPFKKNTEPGKLLLIYAGSPAKKDYLKEVIEGLASLKQDELRRIELKVIGINQHQLIRQCNVKSNDLIKCGESIQILGRISREEVIRRLQTTNFTVLMRSPTLRYAKAGFPTKVAESLATATPVICNLTSDLDMYLKDHENCIIIENSTAESFVIALRKALALSEVEKLKMCEKARQTAELNFDYRIYLEQFRRYIELHK